MKRISILLMELEKNEALSKSLWTKMQSQIETLSEEIQPLACQ